MNHRILLIFFIATSLLLLPASPAAAARDRGQSALVVNGPDQAASMAAGRFGGKVLKVSRSQVGGNPGYRVKMINPDGKVFTVTVDASTGQVRRD